MEEEQDDPFASITKRCKPTPSQEEILKTCPFSRQSELFPADDDSDDAVFPPSSSEPFCIPVESTGIVMVSPPEEFQIPQENSLPASASDDQIAPPTAADGGGENLSSALEIAVDLGKDSDDALGCSGTKVVDGVAETGETSNGVDGGLGGFDATTAEKEAVIAEGTGRVGDDDAVMTEVVDLEVEELGEDNVFVDLPLRETEVDNGVKLSGVVKNGNGDVGRKNIEDLDKFRYVGPSGVVKRKVAGGVGGRRELPPSIRKGASVVGEETGWGNMVAKDRIFKGLLDALKMFAGQLDSCGAEEEEEEEDVDFLETAKRRGMTLPQPRWWPSEGYDD